MRGSLAFSLASGRISRDVAAGDLQLKEARFDFDVIGAEQAADAGDFANAFEAHADAFAELERGFGGGDGAELFDALFELAFDASGF